MPSRCETPGCDAVAVARCPRCGRPTCSSHRALSPVSSSAAGPEASHACRTCTSALASVPRAASPRADPRDAVSAVGRLAFAALPLPRDLVLRERYGWHRRRTRYVLVGTGWVVVDASFRCGPGEERATLVPGLALVRSLADGCGPTTDSVPGLRLLGVSGAVGRRVVVGDLLDHRATLLGATLPATFAHALQRFLGRNEPAA